MSMYLLEFHAKDQLEVAGDEETAKRSLAKRLKETPIERLVQFINVVG